MTIPNWLAEFIVLSPVSNLVTAGLCFALSILIVWQARRTEVKRPIRLVIAFEFLILGLVFFHFSLDHMSVLTQRLFLRVPFWAVLLSLIAFFRLY